MSKVFIIHKKHVQLFVFALLIILLAAAYFTWDKTRPASGQPAKVQTIQLVTGEFSSTTEDGKKLEVYRFDPGSISLRKGEPVELHISGVNGSSHPFVIEGLGIKGEVKKGHTTVVRFTPEQAGTYPIICQVHTDMNNGGPMVGYIEVH
ncbi:cupredoxin domain-containing protein [Paenibacillus glycanilyticus]|uniref:cupredoxin domain-containing protein n=1 Tax=Paenibacillus glycanilyticus TaxID=126569 RepID=UPI00204193F3|nr:cupredoxin domain-containing protein [Paenibacillus glycanilyticus]MCM3629385.1 cupredoxin domain-containing protein [Paenibacillus glycanilyticus]